MGTRHVGLGPGFVDEDKAYRLKTGPGVDLGPESLQDIRPVLLARVRGLYFRVSARRSKKRRIVP